MDKLLVDLGQAVRRLARAPGFTAATVLTLALGIGATTAIFALVDGVLLRPLPYPDPERLVSMRHTAPGLDMPRIDQSVSSYLLYTEAAETVEAMGLYQEAAGNLVGEGEAERLRLALVTPSLLRMLGATPLHGRLLEQRDARPGPSRTILISEGLWRRRFGGDPEVVGRVLEINGGDREVVGVLPAAFAFPSPETQVWFPLSTPESEAHFGGFYLGGVGRLREGATVAEVEAELTALVPVFSERYADATPETLASMGFAPVLVPLHDAVAGDVGGTLWVLLATVLGVLLVAGANVAGLFLVRAEGSRQESAVRDALGAGFGARLRHHASESLLLAAGGGGMGALLARFGVEGLAVSDIVDLPRLHTVSVNARSTAVAVLLTVVAVAAFAAISLARHRHGDLAEMLRAGVRGATGGAERQRARRVLVAAQLALAMLLLVSSGLLVQSFRRLVAVDPGFDAGGVLTVQIGLPFRGYEEYPAARAFFDDALERIRALPGVSAAGATTQLPLVPSGLFQDPLAIEGQSLGPGELPPVASFVRFMPGYFEAMGIGIRDGRKIGEADAGTVAPVLVSRALARRLSPGESIVGRRVQHLGPWHPVVGVVDDVRDTAVDEPPGEIVYVPVLETAPAPDFIPRQMTIVARTSLPPLSLAPAIRDIVRQLDPGVPIASMMPMQRVLADSTRRARFATLLLTGAAGAALFLGAIGVYGVVSYTVSQRTRELGVRLALGARAGEVARMVLREGLALTVVGLLLGASGALVLGRFLEGLLFEVSPTDPAIYVATASLLLAVALAALSIPARRASRIEPVRALAAD